MRRAALVAAAAAVAAAPALAQRLDVDPARTTSFEKPIPTRPGALIASEISETDFHVGLDKRTEQFAFTGRAGEVVTARTRSDIPNLEVVFMEAGSYKVLVRGPAADAPISATLPRDGSYFLIAGAKGPRRFGKYLLSFGSGAGAPPFDTPRDLPSAQEPASAASTPLLAPDLPAFPGITSIRSGETLSRAGGKTGAQMETFQLIGARGDRLRVTATANPAITLTLYAPEGAQMLTAEGVGAATLEAYLPIDGVYFIGVGLSDRGPYKIAVTTRQSDLLFAHFMAGVGYEVVGSGGAKHVSCWVQPGKTRRLVTSEGVDLQSTWLSAGKVRVEGHVNGTKVGFDQSFTLEGETIITNTNGTIARSAVEAGATGGGIWRGYLCG